MKEKKEIISNERRTGDLQEMHNLLMPLARKMLGKKAFAEADVICNWPEIAGLETALYSRPVKIDFKKGERTGGVLWIETAGGAFALELQLKSRMLIDKVNTFFGYGAVGSLKILQNPEAFEKKIPVEKDNIHSPEKILVTEEEKTYIKQVSGGLKTPELSRLMEALGQAIFTNNKK